MRIVSLKIENYRAIEELSLSFSDTLGHPQRITVLAGPNGSGKTSTLFAIVQALRGVMGYRTSDVPVPTRDDMRLPLGPSGWSSRPREISVHVELQFDDEEQMAIPELLELLDLEPPPKLPGGRLTVNWVFPPRIGEGGRRMGWWTASVDPPMPYVRSWLNARKLAIQAWIRKQPGMRYDFMARIGGLSFFPQDRNLRDRVVGDEREDRTTVSRSYDVHENVLLPRGEETDADFERSIPRERSISDILRFLSGYAKNRVPPLPDEQNWEKRIQSTFQRICAPKEYLGYLYREEDPLGAPVLQEGRCQYALAQAASGEQVILEYVTRLTWPTPAERNIVLIDEPEIHLHPAWIRQLYLALPKIGSANQYILTTHSVELRNRAAADNALTDLGKLGEA